MKNYQKVISLCAMTFTLTTPSLSLAAGTAGTQILTSVQISGGYIYVYGRDGNWLNPNACTDNTRVVLNKIDADYSEKYALLAASYLQGKPVNIYSNKCVDVSTTISVPEISSISSSE